MASDGAGTSRDEDVLALTGADLVTVLLFDRMAGRAQRRWSSRPDLFAATGGKPLSGAGWEFTLQHRSPALITRGESAIRAGFPDHGAILGHGIGLIVNLPLIGAEGCVGSVNCLYRDAGFMTDFDLMIPAVSDWVWRTLPPDQA